MIQSTDKLKDFLQPDGTPINAAAREIKTLFNDKIREIQECAESHFICPGEALVLINKTFGYAGWRSIPYGDLDKILEWFKNNHQHRHSILAPEMSGKLAEISQASENPVKTVVDAWQNRI